MSGRLGMTGASVARGDAVFGKARAFVPPKPGQLKTWLGTAGLGAAGVAASHGERKRGNRTGAAVAGGVAGGALTDVASGVGGWAAREHIQHQLRTNPAHKRTKTNRKILSAHKANHGVVEGPGKNPPNAYYRHMPKGVPMYRAQRIMGWKNHAPVVAATIGTGALVGAAIGGRKKREPLAKADFHLTRNGKNLLHMEAANPEHKKVWGAPARMLVVGSGEKRPAARLLLPTRRQWANWGGGAALAYGGKKTIDHQLEKRDNRRRNAVAGGALMGAAGTDLGLNVAGWGTREGIKYHESLVNSGKISHPMSRKARARRLDEHKALHGVSSNTKDAPQAYYRTWPKELPGARARRIMGYKNHPPVVAGALAAGTAAGALYGAKRKLKQPAQLSKREEPVALTMSDRRAQQLASRYDTRGPLPKHLDRNQRMAAYEARYIASGGKKGEKWKRRANAAEVSRNVGLAGATLSAGALLGHKSGVAGLRRLKPHHLELAGLASGTLGGASELYGEHARSKRASYANSPAGVAASALTRMRNYTPGGQQ